MTPSLKRRPSFAFRSGLLAVGLLTLCPLSAQTAWRQVNSGTTARLRSVAYVNGLFIACGENAGTDGEPLYGLVSPDGEHWKKTQLANLREVVRVGNRVAGISNGGREVFLTRDGSNALQLAVGSDVHTSIVDGSSHWLAADGGGVYRVPKPIQIPTFAAYGITQGLTGVAFGNGYFLAKGGIGLFHSQDGTSWQWRMNVSLSAAKLIYGNGIWLSFDAPGQISKKSTDGGVNWTPVAQTPNGSSWVEGSTTSPPGIRQLSFDNGKFALVDRGGIYFSLDGENWTHPFSVDGATFNGAAYGEAGISTVPPRGRWVIVGDGGQIFVSDVDSSTAANLTINSAVQVRWLGETGKSYQVQSSSNLSEWQDLGGLIVGTGIEIVISQPIVPPSRFYRVVPQVP